MPVQVAGREHFVHQFHVATGAAAPIFDISGRLLGVLGIVLPVERYHIHSLGLVAAAARAIENQRQSDPFGDFRWYPGIKGRSCSGTCK